MTEPSRAGAPLSRDALKNAYAGMLAAEPHLRIRDAADRLGVTEAELVASGTDAEAVRLDGNWRALLKEMPRLGRVMTLTRNDHCVHEKTGRFEDVSVNSHAGLVLGPDIDLRIFFSHWHYGFAVAKPAEDGVRRSLQFFDGDGTAVFKVFLREDSDGDAYDDIVARWRTDNALPLVITPRARPAPDRPDAEIDVEGLRARWRALEDTHQFHGLLKEFKVGRVQALRLTGAEFAEPVAPGAFRAALEAAARDHVEIMVFVASAGVIQIHGGPVERVKAMGPWLNVLDPGFSLHLREDRIAGAWIVRKPTVDGTVTSLEIFDDAGAAIALMFGKRKPGQKEAAPWRALVAGLSRRDA
jgi:putative hemin transport protein